MTPGGRRVPVSRPRMRTADDQHELPVASYEYFADRDPLTNAVIDRMLAGVSARKYAVVGEAIVEEIERDASSTSKRTTSELFIERFLVPRRQGERVAGAPAPAVAQRVPATRRSRRRRTRLGFAARASRGRLTTTDAGASHSRLAARSRRRGVCSRQRSLCCTPLLPRDQGPVAEPTAPPAGPTPDVVLVALGWLSDDR
jgi:hypothetical protein